MAPRTTRATLDTRALSSIRLHDRQYSRENIKYLRAILLRRASLLLWFSGRMGFIFMTHQLFDCISKYVEIYRPSRVCVYGGSFCHDDDDNVDCDNFNGGRFST